MSHGKYRDTEKRRRYIKRWKDANHDKLRLYGKRSYWKNKERIKEYNKSYRKSHVDYFIDWYKKHPGYGRNYYIAHKEEVLRKNHEYYIRNRKHAIDKKKEYRETANGKMSHTKTNSKRRRGLGFVLVSNQESPSEKTVFHHIDKKHVVCIPEKLHKSIPHNVWTGKNMKEINELVMKYVTY